jgi:Domain of unknown function (DUF5679)
MRTKYTAPSPDCVTFAAIRPRDHRELCLTGSERSPLMPEGYCVKERKKVEIKDAKQVTMKNGRPAIQGVCPDCGTKIFKIGKLE